MSSAGAKGETKSLSDLLGGLELRGQGWCYSDIGAQAGFSIPPGDGVLFHAVLHGSVRIACAGGSTIELRAGEAIMVLSGEAHALRTSAGAAVSSHEFLREDRSVDIPPTYAIGASGPVAARVLSGRLHANWPGEVNRSSLPSCLRIGGADNPCAALLRPEALPMAGMGAGSAALLTRLAALMLVAGLRADRSCRQLFSPSRQDPIAQSIALIEANPSADWSVERLARSVGMGRSNFAAHFTAQIGRAPMDVVAQHRMELAATLLQQGRLKIAEISEMAGYGSEAAFSRRFTRHFGVSPSQMRASVSSAASEAVPPAASLPPLLASRMAKGATALVRHRPAPPPPPALSGAPATPGGAGLSRSSMLVARTPPD